MIAEAEIHNMAELEYPLIDSVAHSKSNEFKLCKQEAYVKGFLACQQMRTSEIDKLKLDYDNEVLNSQSLQRYWGYEKDKVKELESERDRLREALEKILNQSPDKGTPDSYYSDTHFDSMSAVHGYNVCLYEHKSIAAEALKDK